MLPIRFDGPGEDPSQPPRKRHAKLGHRKSRAGCTVCRTRRVKCDEVKPICGNCTRLDLDCAYGNQPGASNTPDRALDHADDLPTLPETEARRKLELELLYHYSTETAPSISVQAATQAVWGSIMCRSALKSDAVLYCVCLLAILHKGHQEGLKDPSDAEHLSTYLNMAVRAHRHDVANLSVANVDYACLASSALRVYDLIRLQYRSLQPYEPPSHWLRMTGASHVLLLRAWDFNQEYPESLGTRLLRLASHLLDEKDNGQITDELELLMRRQEPYELMESWDDEVEKAYSTTLHIVGGIWTYRHSIGLDKPDPDQGMRLAAFPMIVSDRFVELVEERRPRAMVILAHYFACLHSLRGMWFVGDAGRRETRAIAANMGPEWQSMLIEPLSMVNSTP